MPIGRNLLTTLMLMAILAVLVQATFGTVPRAPQIHQTAELAR